LLRFAWHDELPIILAGSAKLQAKRALAVAKVDRHAEFMLWNDRDCQLALNPKAEWGRIIQEIGFAPALIWHIPNVAFVLSGPFDQSVIREEGSPELAGHRASQEERP